MGDNFWRWIDAPSSPCLGYSPEFAVLGRRTTTDDVAAADDVVAGTWLALGTS